MKITQSPAVFQPVTILLDTKEEVGLLCQALYTSYQSSNLHREKIRAMWTAVREVYNELP